MHADADNFTTVTRFACDHMDRSPELFKVAMFLRDRKGQNLSVYLKYKIFCAKFQLHHSIQFSDKDKRWENIEEKFCQMTNIPQGCLSTKLKDTILHKSLECEIALTPEMCNEEGLENQKSDFEGNTNPKLCSMDVDAILTSFKWQSFVSEPEDQKRRQTNIS